MSGGKIEFQINFNFTINASGNTKDGSGYGNNSHYLASGFSDPTNFTKTLTFGSGTTLRWLLDDKATKDVAITQNLTVRRHSPADIGTKALDAMTASINTATGSFR